ncbi:MATE efflux family protein [Euphorbia peplus]|nr:MATE efflux family protein [Euphorbia peplus]
MGNKWIESLKEVKKVSYVAGPMVGVTVLQYLLQLISMVMVGHLNDQLSLSAVSIATSFTSVSGFSFLFGMAGGVETLCGQAYGAEQYQKLGTYTYTSIILLILLCFPISILWFFTDKILILIGQDHSISHLAQNYSIALIPNLFSYAILQAFIRYFQTQSLIFPMLVSSFCVLCVHVPLCWFMVFKTGFGCVGAGLAIGLSYWVNVVLLGFYIKCSGKCEKTRCGFSKDVFFSMKEMLRFSIPSAAMTCLEWWSYEVLILLSGLLPNPKVETSVLSICFTITYLHYFIPYGFGATVSTRVSNELGAGNPQAAKMAVSAILILALAEMAIMSSVLLACHRILGYAFSSDKEIVHNVADMAPFLCLSVMMDSLQSVFSGIARGSGWQNVGGYVNLGAYYLVGTPVAVVLAFVTRLRAKGLLIGLATGSFVQASLLALRTIFTDWEKQAIKARERIFEGNT